MMIDLDHLRERPELYVEACRVKGIDLDVQEFLTLDEQYRGLIKVVEEMRAQKNSVSKRVPGMKGKEKEAAITEMKKLDKMLSEKEGELAHVKDQWGEMQLLLPTLPLKTVPIGEGEKDNREVKQWGVIPSFTFTPRDHAALGEALDIIDLPRGVKVAGARGYFLKGDGARLHLAVLRFTLDTLLTKGWTLFCPPLLATYDCFMGTGFFPGSDQLNIYAVGGQERRGDSIKGDELYLIGTSEVAVASYHKDEILQAEELPKRYCGYSACFRREVGSYGKDTKGLYRIHHFDKIEQVVLCEASETVGLAMFEEIRTNAEEILQALKLPYRVVDVCTGDMGRGKVTMQDIETWMPSRKSYGETHSCSYLGDFQARRLNIKYKDADGKKRFVHTLNNTCIASPRILIPLLEIYQNRNGTVTVPEVLRPYMNDQAVISPIPCA